MNPTPNSTPTDRPPAPPRRLAALAFGTAALLAATLAAAQPRAFDGIDDATIEDAFWQCDARSTQVALDVGEGIVCERLTDALKQRRFGGDFSRFLNWWSERKAVEHARRGLGSASAVEAALETP
jgi:hypothetical protein